MKKLFSLLAVFLMVMMMPLTVMAASMDNQGGLEGEPEKPYEKLVFSSGRFNTERDGDRMYLFYTGSYERQEMLDETDAVMTYEDGQYSKISINGDIYLRELQMIYLIPVTQTLLPEITCTFVDEAGNRMGPYPMTPQPGISFDLGDETELKVPYSLVSDQDILLRSGDYQLTTSYTEALLVNEQTGLDGAVALSGVDQDAWDKYKENWLLWAFDLQGIDKDKQDLMINEGSDALYDYLYNDEDYRLELATISQMPMMPVIELKEEAVLHELVFNTFNGGLGAEPGDITILDQAGEVVVIYQAAGDVLSDVANGLWVIRPELLLEPGTYTIIPSDPSVLYIQEDGTPEYYASFGPPMAPAFNFSGHYKLDLTVIKTSNIFGPVSGEAPSLALNQHDFDLVDHGDTIEIISEYEGITFAQVCQVIERGEEDGLATLNFDLNLSNTPVGAHVGADVAITLVHYPYSAPKVTIEGDGYYIRSSSGNGDFLSGGDNNTYSIEGTAFQTSKYFSNLVTQALAAAGISGLDNIPGPDFPLHVMVGVALPSLVGVLGHMITSVTERRKREEALAKKALEENDDHLSVGEKAMKASNNNLGKGLYSEKEAEGFAILAEAMANTDEPDDDPFSIGDNEKPSTGGRQQSEEGDDGDEDEPEDNPWADVQNPEEVEEQMDDWMDDPYAGYSEESLEEIKAANGGVLPEEDPILPWEEISEEIPVDDWEKRTIIDNSTGRDMEIARDPYSGEWINPESGNLINMETYEKDVLPNLERDAATIAKHRLDNLKLDPHLVKAFEDIRKEAHKQEQLIKLQRKYGYNMSEEDIIKKIKGNQVKDTEKFQKYMDRAETFDKLVKVAEVVQMGADIGVDVLAEMTGPAGKTIKYIYTGAKGYAGAATEDYVNSGDDKKSFWKSSVVGLGKGGGDLYKAGVGDMFGKSKGFVKYIGKGIANVGGNVITTTAKIMANGTNDFEGDLSLAFKQGIAETGIGEGFDFMGDSFSKLTKGSTKIFTKATGAIYTNGRNAIVGQTKGFTTNYVNSKIEGKKDSTGSDLIDMLFLGK